MTLSSIIGRGLAMSAALGLVVAAVSAQSFVALPRIEKTEITISDVSADGSVIVGYTSTFVDGERILQAFRWTHATGIVSLGILPGAVSSIAAGVSGDGSAGGGVLRPGRIHLRGLPLDRGNGHAAAWRSAGRVLLQHRPEREFRWIGRRRWRQHA